MATLTLENLETKVEKLKADTIPRKEFENDIATMKTLAKLFGEGVETLIKRIDSVEKSLIQRIDTLDKKIDTVEKGLNQRMDTLEKGLSDSITGLKWFVMINLVISGVGFAFLTLILSIGFGFFSK